MNIGLIVAIETDSIFAYYQNPEKLDCPAGFNLYHVKKSRHDIYIIHTGMGEIAAACGVQYLASKYGIDVIINFGVVGGLTADMEKQKLCVIDRVVHYKYDCSEFMDLTVGQVAGHDTIFLKPDADFVSKTTALYPDLMIVTCCSGDKFVGKAEEKSQLHKKFDGDVCDMESAGIVLSCEMNSIPCLLLKAVSDGLAGGAKEFYEELQDAAFKCLEVADRIMDTL